MKEGNKHTNIVYPVPSNKTYSGERAALQSTKMKVIQMGYKKLA